MPLTTSGLYYETLDLRPAWMRDGSKAQPVVFHHGIGANLNIFDEWMPVIATRHPVARFDMRGFGRSVVPPETQDWSMDGLIADLDEVAQAAYGDAPVHVIGESIGGTIVLAAGIRKPDRFVSVAMSNAAINGGRIGHAPGWREEIGRIGIDGWNRRMMEMRFVPGGASPEAIAWFDRVQGSSVAHVVIGLGELLVGTDLSSEVSNYKAPLLLMMPDRSPFVTLAQGTALADLAPQTEIAVFPGAKHGLPLTHGPAVAEALLAFLDRVESGRLCPPRSKSN